MLAGAVGEHVGDLAGLPRVDLPDLVQDQQRARVRRGDGLQPVAGGTPAVQIVACTEDARRGVAGRRLAFAGRALQMHAAVLVAEQVQQDGREGGGDAEGQAAVAAAEGRHLALPVRQGAGRAVVVRRPGRALEDHALPALVADDAIRQDERGAMPAGAVGAARPDRGVGALDIDGQVVARHGAGGDVEPAVQQDRAVRVARPAQQFGGHGPLVWMSVRVLPLQEVAPVGVSRVAGAGGDAQRRADQLGRQRLTLRVLAAEVDAVAVALLVLDQSIGRGPRLERLRTSRSAPP